MLAGDDLGPAPSFLSMAKGKIPSFSQRVIPYCAMDESRNTWENHQDMYVAQKTESDTSPCRLTVGYALTKKKTESFIQPKLLEQTRFVCISMLFQVGFLTGFISYVFLRNKGIHLFPIDSNKELIEQGPFHVILHKVANFLFVFRHLICDMFIFVTHLHVFFNQQIVGKDWRRQLEVIVVSIP